MRQCISLLWSCHILFSQCLSVAFSFAISSSNSPKRKQVTNQSKATGGFGKKSNTVLISHTRDDSPSTQNLVNFLLHWKSEGLGSNDAGTEIGFDKKTGIRGMYATKSFKKNEVICKIPSDCALALSDPSLGDGEKMSVADGAINFLKWYVWNEQARQTWSAYLDTLPTRDAHFDPTPDFYSDEEIEAMEFPMAVKMAKERKEQILELSEKENISFDELQFASWIVSSRSFSIKILVDDSLVREGAVSTTEKAVRVLLPYLDFINHSSDRFNSELHLIDPEKDDAWFAIRAVRPIKKGKEITISYGASGLETSIGLLMNYGFVPDQNRFDAMMLSKGGDGCIEDLEGWSTSLQQDEAELTERNGKKGNMVNILKLRTKLKRSYA